ncbi:uncharacterized protein A1O5_02299 [Cladophialophora psammophila CBS 110553]|uniref:Fanconi-associated nuclease n=1 Tax=Cladophialophora psammophila CBS 110553 TaxID=1182543 RepID=W9X9K0_9EURO|nr:uncharacterized protein A1O5_02299 [Cladophialophora psammophila CBS 110553]EXJ74005.1 hypothetical protein A1O5_02299 [Cladophialophora psammophila CBS 110553]
MALEPKSASMHNRLMGTRIPHPLTTNFHDGDEFPSPPAKRLKAAVSNGTAASPRRESPGKLAQKRSIKNEIADSEEEREEDDLHGRADQVSDPPRATQLEATLPPVKTDEEAIEAYEAYKASEHVQKDHEHRDNDTALSRLESRSWTRGRSSIYVDAFNLALDTVLDEEAHLFNDSELSLFGVWRDLSYEAQYLYVRLFLRKTSKWFRVKDLQYYSDVADMEAAVAELQKERLLPAVNEAPGLHPGELEPPEGTVLGEAFTFAECSSEHIKTLDEASSLLLLDELKSIAKEAKVHGKNKRELLQNFRRTSGRQAGLGFKELKRTETQESGSAVSEDNHSVYDEDDGEESSGHSTPNLTSTNRDAHFTKKILDRTGRCIRLSLTPLKLFERVHLVFYRSTEWTEKSLTTLILAKISRRNFPEYIVSRSTTIFESRALLLEFEASLRTQFRVDNILEFNGTPGRKALEEVNAIFEAVYPRWKALLAEEQRKEDRVYESGEGAYLRRFSPAWVYTRIVHKALHPFARFKEHLREHELLNELLDQRLFHAARRGAWYQRKALLEEHYMHALTSNEGRSVETNKKHWKRLALKTCEQGLQDKECHVIYHHDLQKRVKKLEKHLRVPLREQHDFGHVKLGKAVDRDVVGIKIEQSCEDMPSRSLNFSGKNSINKTTDVEIAANNSIKRPSLPDQPSNPTLGGKTVWLDHLDTNLPVSVESMCLSHYRHVLGYKGYHSEGGILRTIFGLLFHDILFFNPYIPNVFQTAYQTCPLDLHTDSFFSARMPEILARINQISNGEAVDIAKAVWEKEYDRRTCIVGVKWDEFEKDDLLELVACWEGQALGTVMLVMAQEYQSRGGGVPDLVLWKVHDQAGQGHYDDDDDDQRKPQHISPRQQARGEVLFAEVKSANDRLSDTQRLWISVLLSAGVKVELCHAVAGEVRYE